MEKLPQKNKFLLLFLFLLFLFIVNTSIAFAQLNLPPGLQKVAESEKNTAQEVLQNVSIAIAFIAGILSILSPCTYAFLPAFFAYTFKEKHEITKMTFSFFLGFASVFSLLGILAASLGDFVLNYQSKNASTLILLGGVLIIIFGVMAFFGKGFSGILKIQKLGRKDFLGVFLFGAIFGLGWTACTGPTLAGVITMAAVLHNYFYAFLLMLFYSLGIFIPLFLLASLYDKYKLGERALLKGKEFEIFGHKFHSTNVISGLLLIFIGALFVLFRNTAIFNNLDILKTKQYFYIFQDSLLKWQYGNIIGLGILGIVVICLIYYWVKKSK